jgi:hypothetical protein
MNETLNSNAMTTLPTDILRPQPHFNLEAQRVAQKYSNPDPHIGESNIDFAFSLILRIDHSLA